MIGSTPRTALALGVIALAGWFPAVSAQPGGTMLVDQSFTAADVEAVRSEATIAATPPTTTQPTTPPGTVPARTELAATGAPYASLVVLGLILVLAGATGYVAGLRRLARPPAQHQHETDHDEERE